MFKGCWLGSEVAVKVFRSEKLSKERASEAEMLAKLRHPCVCSFFGASVHDNGLALIMELLDISLHDLLHVAESTPTHALCHRIARQTAVGLAYLHLNNIVHRDIKPANVSRLPRLRAARIPRPSAHSAADLGPSLNRSCSTTWATGRSLARSSCSRSTSAFSISVAMQRVSARASEPGGAVCGLGS